MQQKGAPTAPLSFSYTAFTPFSCTAFVRMIARS